MKQALNKISITFLLLFVFAFTSAVAQGGSPAAPSTDSLAARDARVLGHQLSLSLNQRAGVEAAARKFHEAMQGLRGATTDIAGRKAAIKTTHEAYRRSIKDLLTPAQWKTYEEGAGEKKEAFLRRAKEKKIRVVE
jgi:hypothetical protein